ncbi:MAG: recombinase family protein, partial [Clostridia bacterium]
AYHADTPWKSHAVSRILDDAVYSGQLVLNKTHCSFANRQPNAQVPPEERLVFADAHPAIVDRETFEKVSFARQEMQKDKRKCLEATASKREAMPDILSGYLRCGYCGGAMMLERRFNKGERRGSVYLCRKHKRKGCPNAARIPERLVRLVVADSIRVQIDAATAFEKVLPGLVRDPRVLAARTRHEEGITALERKVRSLESKCARMYEDYAAGSLCVDEYKIAKMEAVRHTRDAAAALARAKGELASFEAALSRSDGALCASRSFAELHTLSPELLEAMVKRIEVGSDGGIAIEFVFEDWVGVVDRVWKEIS